MKKRNFMNWFPMVMGFLILLPQVAAAGVLKNNPIDKVAKSGMPNVIGATTFSNADNSETTSFASLKLSEVLSYPSSTTMSMASAYSYKEPASFGTGGTESSPYYTVVSNPRDLGSAYSNLTDGVNRLVFHTPASQASAFTFSTSHKPGTDIYISFDLQQLSDVGQKSKMAVYVNGKYQQNYEFASSELSVKSLAFWITDDEIKNAEKLKIEVRRDNYNEGPKCVYALSNVYIEGECNSLMITKKEGNDSQRLGTMVELTAQILDPALEGGTINWEVCYDINAVSPVWTSTGKTGNVITVNPTELGYSYYRAETDSKYSNYVSVLRKLSCNGAAKIFFHEDFGTLASESEKKANAEVDAIGNYTPAITECPDKSKSVKDGSYAVVANPWYAGVDDGNACTNTDNDKHWFRKLNDHTQGGEMGGEYGGMLLVNCKNPNEVIYENTQTLSCVGSYINFSVWYANAGHKRKSTSVHDINLLLRVMYGGSPVPNSEIVVDATIDQEWVFGEVTFQVETAGDYTIQLINYGKGDAGNDVLVDDILFSQCIPTADLFADKEYEGVTILDEHEARTACGGKIKLDVASDQFGSLYPSAQYYWCDSIPGGSWTYNSTISGLEVKSNVFDVDGESWHKVLIVEDGILFDAQDYLDNGPDPSESCPVMVGVTNDFKLVCGSVELIEVSRVCNSVELVARHDESLSKVVWEKSNDGILWNQIDTPSPDSILKYNIDENISIRASIDGDTADIAFIVYGVELDKTSEKIALGQTFDASASLKGLTSSDVSEYIWYRNNEKVNVTSSASYTISEYDNASYYVEAAGCKSQNLDVVVEWPTIFTPLEQEGLNDTFIEGLGIEVTVVDRYGNVANVSQDGWDGKDKNGTLVLPGVYYYVAKWNEGANVKKGTIEVSSFNK